MQFDVINKQVGVVTVLISEDDADLATLRWSLAGGKGGVGRYVARSGRTTKYLHRIIAERMGIIGKASGEGRSTVSVDHINGNKMDNRRENLRALTRKAQMANPNDGLRRTNTSGCRGVSRIKKTGRWYASVMVDGKTRSLGMHPTKEDAIAARQKWDEAHPVIA